MHISILSSTLKYLYHLLSDHSDSPLLMNALKTSISLHSNGTVSQLLIYWILVVLTTKLWYCRTQPRKKYLINCLRKELEKLYVDQWENERQNINRKQQKSKLELYSNIKSSYRRETYIDDVRDVQTRKCITQISLSAHKFPIGQGRYKNIPREQRICNLCCNNLVGDESITYLYAMNSFLDNRERDL